MQDHEDSPERGSPAWNDLLLSVIKRYYDPRTGRGTHGKENPPDGTILYRLVNRLCGDTVTVIGHRLENDTADRLHLDTQGCAVCRASAALAEQSISDLESEAAKRLCDSMVALINGESQDCAFPETLSRDAIRDLEAFGALREVPGRRRCATLSWEALRTVLGGETQ